MQDQPRGEIWYVSGRSPAPHVPPTFWSRPTTLFDAGSPRESVHYPAAIADGGGNVHLFWSHGFDRGTSQERSVISYMRWDRTSWSWSEPTNILESPQGSLALLPRVALDPDDVLYVMWLAFRGGVIEDDIYFSHALASDADSSEAWSQPLPFPVSSMLFGAFQIPYDILADQAGNLHVAYARYTDGYYDLYYARSSDKGDTWAWPVGISNVRKGIAVGGAALAIDGNGRLHVAWLQILTENSLDRSVWYSRSSDGGQTWERPLQITDVYGYSEVNIAVTGKETIHLMWNGAGGKLAGRYHQWSADGGESWTAAVKILGVGGWAGEPQMVVDGAGTLHLVTSSSVADPMVYTFWDGATWAEPVEVSNAGGERLMMVLHEGNKLSVVVPSDLRESNFHALRWTTRRISAPYVPPRPLATPAPVPTILPAITAAPVSTTSPASAPVSESTPTATWQGGSRSSSAGDLPPAVDSDRNSAWYPLVAGILPAALLVVVVILSWTVRSRRHW